MSDDVHYNQPDGDELSSAHPASRGRERELRALADALRRLIRVTTSRGLDAGSTATAAARVETLVEELETAASGDPIARYAFDAAPSHPHDLFQWDAVLGIYNPLALPVEVEWSGEKAIGMARFTAPYEGPPGCVHGAILAGVFDQIFNVVNIESGCPGPTERLELRYLRPTKLARPLVFEGWIAERNDERVRSIGQVRDGNRVTVEAEGIFRLVPEDRILRMGTD